MTCGSSEPLVTAGDRCCPYSTVAARTQRGPSAKIHQLFSCTMVSLRGHCAAACGLASGGCAVHDGDRG
jgi:hypothetical protein